jgi:hypothetical protein
MKSFSSPKIAKTFVLFAMMESKNLHVVAVLRQHLTISNVHFKARGQRVTGMVGEWSTAHSSNIMKVVLAFIYCGNVHEDLEPLELLSVAAEYDIPSLKAMAETRFIQIFLGCENVNTFLQAAHLHRNEPLKSACFLFIRNNAAQVLTDPDIESGFRRRRTLGSTHQGHSSVFQLKRAHES